MLALLLVESALSTPIPTSQPGALQLYPPTKLARFSVALDHFRFRRGEHRFGLRYATYESFAPNRTAPVLFYCGNEGALETFYNHTGAMFELAQRIGAYVLFVEHRFYGDSLPFGRDSFSNDALQYLSIEQALADYAEVIVALPTLLGCRGTGRNAASGRCDTVLFGGSYGGMLAAWHRYKYPHLSRGAVASGAPVDFYPGEQVQPAFLAAVAAAYDSYGASEAGCAAALLAALHAADVATPSELASAGVRACAPLDSSSPERYAFYARGAVASIAMLDYPYPCACAALASEAEAPLPALHRAVLGYVNASGDLPCVDLRAELVGQGLASARGAREHGSDLGVTAWNYQACTELLLEPITSDGYGFYPESAPQLASVSRRCEELFGVEPRPFWMELSFGRGADFRQASNIFFSENDKDPWHVGTRTVPAHGGVNDTVTRFVARGGAHHQDLRFASVWDAPDVHKARALEESAIRQWLR